MNVMYCFEGFPYPSRGGISQVTIRESAYFRVNYDMECHCLCLCIEPECEDVSVFNGHIIVDYGRDSVRKIAEYIIKHNIKIVIFEVIWNFKLFRMVEKACRKIDVKIITSIHGIPGQELKIIEQYFRRTKRMALRERVIKQLLSLYLRFFYWRDRRRKLFMYSRSVSFISLTADNSELFKQYYRLCESSKLAHIPNPLTFDTFADAEVILSKEPIVLLVARFEESTKRISMAIRIWSEIEKIGCGDWQFVIVGSGESEAFYHSLARELGVRKLVFVGRQNPLPYYQKASIFMMTSAMEGFGVTLIESQQNGVVPIAMDSYPTLHFILQNGHDGIIVPNNNMTQYTKSLRELMVNSEQRTRMALNAIQSSRKFEINKICEQWIKHFKSVCDE